MTKDELQIVRRVFARQILAIAGVAENARLEAAFRKVPREHFLGSDPWVIADARNGLLRLPSNDPIYAYQDVLFSLSQSRGVNNGGPSLHARLLDALSPQPEQNVVHLGAGTGYYTAMLAELVGLKGRVTAVEIDPVLGRMARENLSNRPNVDVIIDDARTWPRKHADRIYLNFAVTAPVMPWINYLSPAGRLVIPLGVPGEAKGPAGPRFSRHGSAFLIEQRRYGFGASYICPAYFIHAEDDPASTDKDAIERLQRAFRSKGVEFVRSLIWRRHAEPGRCWMWSPDWSLSYDPVSAVDR